MRCALVTGGTGFIGRTLCERLKSRGLKVYAVARNSADGPWDRMIVADVRTGPLSEEVFEGVDTVFHLAGKVHALADIHGEEAEYVSANIDGTRNVLSVAAQAMVPRFVLASSVKAGGEGSDICLDEAMEDHPETCYGRTKLEAERIVFKLARENDMHAVVLRLPLVYGPGHKGNLERMLQAVTARRFPPLPEFGNQRSMVHVKDVARAAILAAESPNANVQTYIVTDGRPYSTRELYALMCLALGRRRPRVCIPRKLLQSMARFGDIIGRLRGRRFIFDSYSLEKLSSSAWYSSKKIENELGFRSEYDLEKALPEMIAALRGERQPAGNPAPTP